MNILVNIICFKSFQNKQPKIGKKSNYQVTQLWIESMVLQNKLSRIQLISTEVIYPTFVGYFIHFILLNLK